MADQVASILSWLRESAQLAFADAVPIIRLYAIPVIGLILWLVMSCISTASVIIIIWRYSRPPQPKSSNMKTSEVPGVSVLRPLKGVDENLKDNLASCFRLNYPKFELLFSVASDKDPAIEVVRELKEEFPNVDATMIIGDVNVGYEIIWILDSNVIVDKDSMGRSVDLLMLPRVGLVHHLPIGTRPVAFGSVMYVVINKVAVASCIVGKSNLFWKWTLNGVGGVHKFGRFMSEDNIIGNYIWNQRLRHMMTSDVAYQPLGKLSLEDYFTRRARWTRIRKYTVVGATLFEPFTESVVNAIFSAYSLNFSLVYPPNYRPTCLPLRLRWQHG
ncbi:glycosyl transferase family 21-domain-containing protein [Chytridium lagenaria]|nr:glycosyl transferase family 21-domain-containing protein [Chytridium lagenaria]